MNFHHLWGQIPYEELPYEPVQISKRDEEYAYDDVKALESRSFAPAKYGTYCERNTFMKKDRCN